MELSPGRQRLLLVVLVIILAAIGLYLAGPGRGHGSPGAAQSPGRTTGGGPVSSPSASPLSVPSAAVAPTLPTSFKNASIYDWLPFTQRDLDAAASVTVAFAAADETFSYADTPATYGRRLSGLVTPALLGTLEQQFQPSGTAAAWQRQQLASRSGGTIDRITASGASPQKSITFVITLTEHVTADGKTTTMRGQYDVTAVAAAGGWQVSDIEQAGAGNQ